MFNMIQFMNRSNNDAQTKTDIRDISGQNTEETSYKSLQMISQRNAHILKVFDENSIRSDNSSQMKTQY